MKKLLTLLGLIALLGVVSPAFAAPPPPPGGHHVAAGHGPRYDMRRPPHNGGHIGHYGYYKAPRPYAGVTFYGGYYPRLDSFYNHRLGYPYCRCPYCIAHRPVNGAGFYISF